MKNTLDFLTILSDNNNKPWFDENRKQYEQCRKEFIEFVGDVIKQMSVTDPIFSSLDPKKCIFRINRDIRFSKDKSPYKTNFGAWFTEAGAEKAGYYIHLEPGNKSFIGGGIYMPEAEILKKIRQEIDYGLSEFQGITEETNFKKLFPIMKGDKLSRPPKGYDETNPAIELLKHKSLVVSVNITDQEIIEGKLSSTVIKTFTTMQPFIGFLNRAFE